VLTTLDVVRVVPMSAVSVGCANHDDAASIVDDLNRGVIHIGENVGPQHLVGRANPELPPGEVEHPVDHAPGLG